MKINQIYLLLIMMIAGMWLYATPALADDQVMHVGKKGDVTFTTETTVGDLTMPPGPYRIRHRVEGSDHYIHFEALTRQTPYHRTTQRVKGHPGEVLCKVEPLGSKVSRTTVYKTSSRITKVEIAGEDVAHLF